MRILTRISFVVTRARPCCNAIAVPGVDHSWPKPATRMTRTIDDGELLVILEILGKRADGLSRTQIQALSEVRSGHPLRSRTLQRRLSHLRAKELIEAKGEGRSVVYRLRDDVQLPHGEAGVDDIIPISARAAGVRRSVRRPVAERKPVGYRAEFLKSYVPGETWYLDQPERDRLHEMGATPGGLPTGVKYARGILDRLRIDLSWASGGLEGNTYTRLETWNLIEFGHRAEDKPDAEAQMILNHDAAIELLVDHSEGLGFDVLTFRNLHAVLAENLLADPRDEGRLRNRAVHVADSAYTPLGAPQRIEEVLLILLEKAEAIPDPFEQAFFVMVHVAYLQPFMDGNARLSRLAANIPLIKHDLCPLSFVDVPREIYADGLLGVYELGRIDLLKEVFVWAYERSSRQYGTVRPSRVEPNPFRLRYRSVLAEFLASIVRTSQPPTPLRIREAAADRVPPADLERFVELALGELMNLNEGNVARYRLLPAEFHEWSDRWRVG